MKIVTENHKHITWGCCTAHAINLIFKDIGKLSWADQVVSKARKVSGVERECMHDATPNPLSNYHEGIIPMLLHYLFP
eukprot:1428-Chlamydomonas_euryale.AAC.1